MVEPVDPALLEGNKSAFMSFLDWLDRGFQIPAGVVQGLLGEEGAFERAGRHALDMVGEIPDAFLPGDFIPNATTEEDFIAPSELVGMDEDTHWLPRIATDVGLGTLGNFMTYVPGGLILNAIGKTAKGAATVAKALPAGEKVVEAGAKGLAKVRAATGNLNLTPEVREGFDTARGAGQLSGQVSTEAAKGVVQGLGQAERRVLADLVDNLKYGPDGRPVGLIDPSGSASLAERLSLLRSTSDEAVDWQAVERAAGGLDDLGKKQWAELVAEGAVGKRMRYLDESGQAIPAKALRKQWKEELPELRKARQAAKNTLRDGNKLRRKLGMPDLDDTLPPVSFDDWYKAKGISQVVDEVGRENYLQRVFKGTKETPTGQLEELAGNPSATKARKLTTDEDLLKFLQDTPDASLVRDAGARLLGRAEQQGRIVERARAVRKFIGDDAVLNDPKTAKAIEDLIETAAQSDPDFAQMLTTKLKGMPKQGAAMELLNKANRYWKPAVVFGLGIPRFAGISKNRIGGVYQALSAGDAGLALSNLKRLPSDMANAFGFKIGGKKLTQAIDDVDVAIKESAGDVNKARQLLRERNPMVAEAVEQGVLDDGFVTSEQLLRQIDTLSQSGAAGAKFQSFLDYPARVFRGIEQRMRLGTFMDLRKRGVNPAKAAQTVQNAYLDYSISSPSERTVRSIIPFAAFSLKSLSQQGKAVMEKPGLAIAAGQLFGSRGDEVLPPYIEEQMNVGPLGEDDEGNPIYAAGLGMPIEVLNLIPSADNLGADLRRGVVASSQPLLKGLYGGITGRDAFFDTPYGQYDKAPQIFQSLGADERSEAARIYNLIDSLGLIQPFSSIEAQASKMVDPRANLAQSLANTFTGARFVGVDEDQALRQQLQSAMARNPDIEQFTSPYTNSEDEETRALLRAYNELKSEIRAKRKEQALESAD